jgi:predicted Zn finger-like uncharacterized protein
MYTACPNCTLTLLVTAADLRAGQGYVRCGRCTSVFNALVSLTDEHDKETGTGPTAALVGDVAALGEAANEPESTDFPATEPAEAPLEEPLAGEIEYLDDDAEPAVPAAAESDPGEPPLLDVTEEVTHVTPVRVVAPEPARQAAVEPEGLDFEPMPPRESAAARFAWSAAAVLLLLALGAQAMHHYRHDLATDPRLGPWLADLYGRAGLPLNPRWNLDAYEVRQLGASAGGPDSTLTVRASVRNGADRAQPPPLLRVTVQDRFGNTVAAGHVPPARYLPASFPAGRALAPGQRVDAQLAFVDPGENAAGFEIDACLQRPGGVLACASDSRAR